MQNSTDARGANRAPRRGGRGSSTDRRTRTRLRDLCDEVLASYRVARGGDPISGDDRAVARALLQNITPLGR